MFLHIYKKAKILNDDKKTTGAEHTPLPQKT